MTYHTLISLEELYDNLDTPKWVIVDCRFDLEDTKKGRQLYLDTHIPGAVYAHLNDDLSGPIIPGKTGRHPLPNIDTFVKVLSNWGIDGSIQVVAYDDRGGAIAARLWWILRWLGHDAVAVLDGCFTHWVQAGFPTRSGIEENSPIKFNPQIKSGLMFDVEEVMAIRNKSGFLLIDSRSPERFHGINEPIDPIAGHIPGAINVFFGDNLAEDGHFKNKNELRARFDKILKGFSPENIIFYCGSGVTAIHNILTLVHIGFGDTVLYPGSWSEWITDPSRPIDI